MSLRQTTLSNFWPGKIKKEFLTPKSQLKSNRKFESDQSLNSNTISRNRQESGTNIQSVKRPSSLKKVQKKDLKADNVENGVFKSFKMRMKQLISFLHSQRAKKNGESTDSNTTQQQKNQSLKRNYQDNNNQSKSLDKSIIQRQKNIYQPDQTFTNYTLSKQEKLKQKKKTKNAMNSSNYHKIQEIIIKNQQIQNAQIRFQNGFQYRIFQGNGQENDSVWIGTNEIMKLNPQWILEYFDKFV